MKSKRNRPYYLFFLLTVFLSISFTAVNRNDSSGLKMPDTEETGHARVLVHPQDNLRGLNNPDMGWYYYKYDNSPHKYGTRNPDNEVFDYWPGMTAIYYRIDWGHLEPEKGKYNWDMIDNSAKYWIAAGKQLCFRITALEGYENATPEWVGTGYDPDHPAFLKALDDFLAAFAERYDGKPYVAYIDIGTIGIWGEGHGAIDDSVRIRHIDMHLKHFKKTLLVINDDFGPMVCEYARKKGMTIRDDSVMWHFKMFPSGVSYETYWPVHPTIIETCHYDNIKNKYNPWNVGWSDEALLETIEKYHASWVSVHGWPDDFWSERQECIKAANLRMGYRLQLIEASWIQHVTVNRSTYFVTKWRNAGVAPCYGGGYVAITIKNNKDSIVAKGVCQDFNVRSLEPGPKEIFGTTEGCLVTLNLPKNLQSGEYRVYISVGNKEGEPVYALPYDAEDDSLRYLLGKINIVEENRIPE
ncbi:MAG: DUF4832 domain-containing protein [Tannerella sp.]|jgi:hypothetical protein|nr:DUF4832 domain-containing protein [Tannerella sp.]